MSTSKMASYKIGPSNVHHECSGGIDQQEDGLSGTQELGYSMWSFHDDCQNSTQRSAELVGQYQEKKRNTGINCNDGVDTRRLSKVSNCARLMVETAATASKTIAPKSKAFAGFESE